MTGLYIPETGSGYVIFFYHILRLHNGWFGVERVTRSTFTMTMYIDIHDWTPLLQITECTKRKQCLQTQTFLIKATIYYNYHIYNTIISIKKTHNASWTVSLQLFLLNVLDVYICSLKQKKKWGQCNVNAKIWSNIIINVTTQKLKKKNIKKKHGWVQVTDPWPKTNKKYSIAKGPKSRPYVSVSSQ